ncbi:recombinase family protein [Streptomyces sp. NPDC059970]|uniref:recombinase family protein n=1 Tax=Streptomyces sp. NPDC059970 TaxID=3347019 RepID=UPI0036AF9686
MPIGYCRISTADQSPDHQIDALLRADIDRDNIHVDTASGAKASRPKPDLVMQLLREGDTLKVTRFDRLSRSVLHLITFGAELRERGIGLHVIEKGIDTSTMEGRARDGHRRGLLPAPSELLSEITHGALERLLSSRSPRELDRTAADLLRATVDTVLHGAIRSAHPASTMNNSGRSCRRPAITSRRWVRDWGNWQGGIGDRGQQRNRCGHRAPSGSARDARGGQLPP